MLTQEEFDKLLQEFDIEKLEFENLEIHDNTIKEINEIKEELKDFNEKFYDEQIEETNKKIKDLEKTLDSEKLSEKDLEKTQDSEKLSEEDLSFFTDDEYIKKYIKKGYLSEEYVTGIAAQTNHKYQSEKKERDKEFLQFLKKHLDYLKKSKKNFSNSFNQMDKYLTKINQKKLERKQKIMSNLKEEDYKKYKEKCEEINQTFKNKMKLFKETFVKEDIKKFNEEMEKFNSEIAQKKLDAESFYIKLKNRKPTIISSSGYWEGFFLGFGIGFFAGALITGVIIACFA